MSKSNSCCFWRAWVNLKIFSVADQQKMGDFCGALFRVALRRRELQSLRGRLFRRERRFQQGTDARDQRGEVLQSPGIQLADDAERHRAGHARRSCSELQPVPLAHLSSDFEPPIWSRRLLPG